MSRLFRYLIISICSCLISLPSFASVVIGGTRVIYPAGQKEVTVKLDNVGKSPVLIQSWIDNGDAEAKPDNISVPFILTPPINRIEAKKGQTLRLSYSGTPLPANKESVFYLNVLEIPAKDKALQAENLLQMAFRSRIKLFFRPAGLTGNANDAVKALSWTAGSNGVSVTNPTPYHVSLVEVVLGAKKVEGQMVAPGGSQSFVLPGARAGSELKFSSVNDYGAIVNGSAIVK
ncbi:molecular chaperone [Erwinia aphidicola]|jgi:chaperone protein EcpD|uniref:Fimbria/pilus periplasmic chaperone n=1 Tax=Erwinia aphidicola TaxID=68334 RepID=A0ABU8DEY0_ERWAP